MILKYFLIVLLFYLYCQIIQGNSESITYFSIERPVTFWYDTTYIKNFTWQSKRLRRKDPRHYVSACFHTLFTADNNIKLDYYFYQFLTNRYRPSFVEMHCRLCDLLNIDKYLGETFRKALGGRVCPFPPGVYDLQNMTFPYIPKSFPFTKGRIYIDMSLIMGSLTKLIANGSIDFEIKVAKINKN